MELDEIKRRNREAEDYIRRRLVLVVQKNYTQLLPHFIRILRFTRLPFLRKNSIWTGLIQLSILRNILLFQSELTGVRKEMKPLVLSKTYREELENKELIYEEWLRIIQTIADGIAWRAFDFDRPVLRLLSDNQAPGFLEKNVEKIYKKFVGTRHGLMLINDITRYLRVGDLTHVDSGKIVIYELKENGKRIQDISGILKKAEKHGTDYLFTNNRLSRQRHRHWTAQMSIINRSIDVPLLTPQGTIRGHHRAEIVDSNIPILTHHKALKRLIRKANRLGIAQEEVEPGYVIKVKAWDKLMKGTNSANKNHAEEKLQAAHDEMPKWCTDKKTKVMDIASTESFHREGTEFPRNFTPHSVLPLSAKECVRIMMGALEITSYLNIDQLGKTFEQNGWTVEELEPENYEPIRRTHLPDDFMKENVSEDFFRFTRSDDRGTYTIVLPLTLVIMMLASYYKIDFLLKATEYQSEQARAGGTRRRNMTLNFIREKEVLL